MTKLRELYLDSNHLSGNIPSDIGNLKLLEVLLLQSNQLTGPLPKTMSSLTNLLFLDLNGNRLSGSIPGDFLNNSLSLSLIDFSSNNFSGSIFMEFNVPQNLEYINLSGNQFAGLPFALHPFSFVSDFKLFHYFDSSKLINFLLFNR